MSWLRRRPAWVDLGLAVLVAWLAASIYLSQHGAGIALSSDNVVPYVLFDDLFRRDLPLAGWLFPEAPFWLPDVPLAWFAYLAGGSLQTAVLLYACVSSTLFLLLARWLLQRAGFASNAWRLWLAAWLACVVTGASDAQGWFTWFQSPIFVPYNHSGALLGTLAGMALLIGDRHAAPRARFLALALLSIALLLSDRLFAVQFVLPALAWCIGMRWWRRSTWHGHAALLLGGLLVASEGLRWALASAGADPFGGDQNLRIAPTAAWAGMLRDFAALAGREPILSLCVVLAAAATVALCVAGRATSSVPHAGDRSGFALLVLLVVLAPLAASVVLGRHISIEAFRYGQSVVLLGLPVAALLARWIARTNVRPIVSWSGWGVLTACVALALTAERSRAALHRIEQDQAACLRDAAQRENLTLGAAGFWHAVEMTARFPHAPVLIPLAKDAAPRLLMANVAWLGAFANSGEELPTLDFVDEYGYSADVLDRTYGAPFERVACPRSTYRIYRAQQGALAQLFRHAAWLPSDLLARVGRAVVPAAAWASDTRFTAGDAVHARGVFTEPATVVSSALDVPPGRLQLWIDYVLRPSASAASVRWEVVALDGQGHPRANLGGGQLETAPTAQRVELPLRERNSDIATIGIAIAVQGDADLQIRAIGMAVARD